MLELQKRVLNLKYDGKEHEIRFPSVRDLSEYQDKYKKAVAEDQVILVVEFLIKLGLEEEVANSLEVEHVEAIMKELTSSKKD